MTAGEVIEKLRAQSEHPDTDCVAFVDEVVPALLRIAEASANEHTMSGRFRSCGLGKLDKAVAALGEAVQP